VKYSKDLRCEECDKDNLWILTNGLPDGLLGSTSLRLHGVMSLRGRHCQRQVLDYVKIKIAKDKRKDEACGEMIKIWGMEQTSLLNIFTPWRNLDLG